MSPIDREHLRDRLVHATDRLPIRGVPVDEITRRGRRRRRNRALTAVGASTCAVIAAVVGVAALADSNNLSTPAPLATHRGASPTPTMTPSLPTMDLPAPPVPSTFVADWRYGIALFDSSSGALVRQLTNPTDYVRDHDPRSIGTGASQRIWFVHTGDGTCGNTEVDSVPADGGTARTEFSGPAGADIGSFAAASTDAGVVIAYEAQTCPPARQAPNYLVVQTPGRPLSRIELPRDAFVLDLDLTAQRLAFVLTDSQHRKRLFAMPLSGLAPGRNTVAAATAAKPLPDGCEWDHVAWSDLGLLATQTCQNLDPHGWPTTLYALNPETLEPTQQGPTIAHDLGINALSSDPAGHLLVWLAGGDTVGAVVQWTSDGARRLHTARCTSAGPRPDPCLRDPAW